MMARPRELASSLACSTNWVARGGKREMAGSDGEVRRVPLSMVGRGEVSGERQASIGGQGKRE